MDNIEAIVIDWLSSFSGDYEVSGDKPATAPNKFILVDRTGGPREYMVLDRAEILIEVYDKSSRIDASQMANEIADKIIELEGLVENITNAEVNSLVHLDDTLGQFHRYQVYCDIFHRR